ncbi:ATP-binding protein [Psychroflexus montanilacus]|uniref:ATP-binding protein n=1 Tax=Psychroflexus montanilacus TaxID=2873598 RepID=UPI001CCD88C4|nr:ATP-binding protein [Psychroflexus montanilacus]MBZ9650908.1 PAS domain-containing protein [Psychroflexus montanilacus]
MRFENYLKSEVSLKAILILSVFIILLIGGFTYKYITNLTYSQKLVNQTYNVNLQLKQLVSQLRRAENLHKNYILTKDAYYVNTYLDTKKSVNTTVQELNNLIGATNQQSQNLKTLDQLINDLYLHFSKINTFTENDSVDTKIYNSLYYEERLIMNDIINQTDIMYNKENEHLITTYQKEEEYTNYIEFTPLFYFLTLLVILMFIVMAYIKISNDLKLIKAKNELLLISKESSNQSEIIGKYGNWIWHVEANTFQYSDNLYRMLGEEPNAFEASPHNFLKFVHPEDVQKLTDGLNKMMDSKELPFINYRIIEKNGSIKYLKAYAKSIYGLDGQKRVLGTTTDITEETKNLLVLEERNLELERNNKELTAFNYAASHDLQEPLRKIQTFVSRLQEKEMLNISATGIQYFEGIKSAVVRMRLLIDDLIHFSKANKPHEVYVRKDLNTLFENAKKDLAEIIEEKKAEIITDKLPEARIIAFQIQQLFSNLLSNSLKYSKKDTSPIIKINYSKVISAAESHLSKAVEGSYHKITVTDNGIGFEQKYSNKIFELFTRLHNKQDYSGTGIGLSICKKIVENHKGYIFSKGESNIGAVFTIYIPIHP